MAESRFLADDRVLLLQIPAFESIASLARILSRGVLVVLGSRDEVDRARQSVVEFENVMVIEGDASRIPWRDGFFTKIVASEESHAGAEIARVLAPGGRIVNA